MIPFANAEKSADLRHLAPDHVRAFTKTFKTECQLMPHLIGHGLIVWILHNVADFGYRCTFIQLVYIHTAVSNDTFCLSGRAKLLF